MFRFTFRLLVCALLCLCDHAGLIDGAYPVCNDQRSACSCMTDQGLIDLSPLDSDNSRDLRFNHINNPANQDTYFFNPCTPFSLGSGTSVCSGVSVCQGFPRTNSTDFWNFGEHSASTFQNAAATQNLQIVYRTTGLPQRTTTINLECHPSVEGELNFVAEDPENHAIFRLGSKYACPQPVSAPYSSSVPQTLHATTPAFPAHSIPPATSTKRSPPIDRNEWNMSAEYDISPMQLVVAGAVAACFVLVILQCAWMALVRRARRPRIATTADGKKKIILRKVALWTIVNQVEDTPKQKF